MYDSGSRSTLRTLPLIYYRRLIEDSENEPATLLKYVWTACSEISDGSVESVSQEYPNPHRRASLTAMKFAEFSSIWVTELLDPDSTLLQMQGFPRIQ